MIDRRTAIGISTTVGIAAMSAAPAQACRVLRKESRTPAKLQIEEIASQIETRTATGAIVASERLRTLIAEFVATAEARRNRLQAKKITTIVSKLYDRGDDQVFLVNFHSEGSRMIVLSCGDNFENNHAIIGFKAGSIVDFQPMTVFNSVERAELAL